MTTTPNIADLLAGVKASQARLPDIRDLKSDHEKAANFALSKTHADVIGGLMNWPDQLAREQRELDDLEARRAAVVAKQAELEQALLDAPPWREHEDARERDRRYDHLQHLHRALERLRKGTLLRAPDQCYEPISYLDRRIAEVRERRDRAQAALDGCLRQAEQLLAVQPVTR